MGQYFSTSAEPSVPEEVVEEASEVTNYYRAYVFDGMVVLFRGSPERPLLGVPLEKCTCDVSMTPGLSNYYLVTVNADESVILQRTEPVFKGKANTTIPTTNSSYNLVLFPDHGMVLVPSCLQLKCDEVYTIVYRFDEMDDTMIADKVYNSQGELMAFTFSYNGRQQVS